MSEPANKKEIGSYYTPQLLADFMVYHLFDYRNFDFPNKVSVLEPSVGDGVFFRSILINENFSDKKKFPYYRKPADMDILAVERELQELNKAKVFSKQYLSKRVKAEYINADYLSFHLQSTRKFDLIIGNPPYIKSNYLTQEQTDMCYEIHGRSGLSKKKIKNIWTSFLVGAVQSLTDDGALAFVLPAELLQVIYAKEIRDLLKENFKSGKIDIFSFNKLVFDDIEQDVIVLICAKNQKDSGVSFYHVNELEDLKKPNYVKDNSNVHRTTLDKWTNYILSDSELTFLDDIKARYSLKTVRSYSDSVAGIVTAANDYFIASRGTVEEFDFSKHVKPIIKKSSYIPRSIKFTAEDLAKMYVNDVPCMLIDLENKSSVDFPVIHKRYLAIGISDGLDKRYKMKLRENWYAIPSVWGSEAFFTKRSNIFPRIILNDADALVTDSFYRIRMKDGYKATDLTFSFYNTLTFIYAELEGRYYGGSVLELTPNEFKNLTIPFVPNVKKSYINKLDRTMRSKVGLGDLLNYTDRIILEDHLGMTNIEVQKLRKIYVELVKRRLKDPSEDFLG